MCNCLLVSKNSYYNWLRTIAVAQKHTATTYLKTCIKTLFEESRCIYGSARIQKSLEKQGLLYSRSYIAVLMRTMNLKSVLSKKFKVVTTDSNHSEPVAKNLLNRGFRCDKLGQKWVSDITYIRVANRWNYITTILDLADRKIVSWTLSEDMTSENTVYKAWLKAIKKREITEDHIFHSDRGVQYATTKMHLLMKHHKKIKQSMSRKGNCWDNAVAESFFKTLKYECTNRYKFKTHLQAFETIKSYINWYNYKRIHSSIGYKTPAEKELEIRINNFMNVA
jgi:putative transposase